MSEAVLYLCFIFTIALCVLLVGIRISIKSIERLVDTILLVNGYEEWEKENVDDEFISMLSASELEEYERVRVETVAQTKLEDNPSFDVLLHADRMWEEQFRARINGLKDMLGVLNPSQHTSTPAEELHPMVKNIPDALIEPSLEEDEIAE